MKQKVLCLFLSVCLLIPLLTMAAFASPSEADVYNSMLALKTSYPEGMRWTNDNSYAWNGGIYSVGYGCAGFAFILSDAAFGSLPARVVNSFTYDDIRVGDILRMNGDTHSVIVLKVTPSEITVAEGNYDSSIHWGRVITKNTVMSTTNYILTRYLQAAEHTHSYGAATTEPTCTDRGYTTYTCNCGDSYISDFTDALGHDWDQGVITTAPTENSNGVMTYTCSRCNLIKTESIPREAHIHSYNKTIELPSCTDRGYTTYTCNCGDSYISDFTDALGHDWGQGVITTAPTEYANGVVTYTCTVCGYIEEKEIPMIDHTHTLSAEWITDAANHWHICANCTEILDKSSHTYSEWEIIKEATSTETGNKERVCSACGYKETVEIPKNITTAESSNPVDDNTIDDTGKLDSNMTSNGTILWVISAVVAVAGIVGVIIFIQRRRH